MSSQKLKTERLIRGTTIPRVELDPVTLQVLGGSFTTVAREMALVLFRMSYSSIIRESEDIGAGVVDLQGRQICEAECTPMHVMSLPGYVRGFLKRLEGKVDEGDIILHNHPYLGATHSPDLHIAVPIFVDGQLLGFSAVQAHVLDNGSMTAGLCMDAIDIWAEGRIYNAVKIYEKGVRNEELWRMILDNVRTPKMNESDMNAMIASAEYGRERFVQLVEKYGASVVMSASEEWMEYSERMLRKSIEQVPDGVYRAEAWLDDDGRDRETKLPVKVKVTIDGGDLIVDLEGSAGETMGSYNAPFEGSTMVAASYMMRTMFLDEALHEQYIPQNDGMVQPLTMLAPEGSIFNPRFPRSAFARFCQINLMADCIRQALLDVMPDTLCAGTSAHIHFVSYSGYIEEEQQYWVYLEVDEGSYGGRKGKDGMDAVDALCANTRNVPIEETEWHHPLRVERYELRPEPAAAGQWRGGLGIIRDTRYLSDGYFTCEGDRHKDKPLGAFGGKDGWSGAMYLNPGTDGEVALPSKISGAEIKKGDVIRIMTPCGGGYGDPLERSTEMVLSDVLDGWATIETAERDYKVAIDAETMTVDQQRTAELRAERGDGTATLETVGRGKRGP